MPTSDESPAKKPKAKRATTRKVTAAKPARAKAVRKPAGTAVRRTRKAAAAPEPVVQAAETPNLPETPTAPPPSPIAVEPVAVPPVAAPEPVRAATPEPITATAAAPATAPETPAPAAPAWEPMPGTYEPPRRQERPDRPSHWRDRHRHDRGDRGDRGGDRGDRGFSPAPRQGEGEGEGENPQVMRIDPQPGEGLLEVSGKGFGFLRDSTRNFVQSPQDIFVTPELVRRYGLRDGLWIAGDVRRGPRGPQLLRITAINGEDPEKCRTLPVFEELTCLNPSEWIPLETVPDRYTTRVIDLVAPIGKGQRGLIVAPPRTGKTTLLQHMAEAVLTRHPEMHLMILLVDERPEEVTEIRRAVPKAEILASSNDSDLKSHTRIAELAIERARRMVEFGRDVFLLLDSITRVARAFNNAMAHGGRTMSGGVDSRAMEIPRRLFASARNTDEGGSLTIMGTALVQTGSKADELIFQEFKGTGNMELVLDRAISDQRVYPAVDIFASGTRREELLLPVQTLDKISVIRRGLSGHRPIEAIERLLSFLRKFPTNEQMLTSIPAA